MKFLIGALVTYVVATAGCTTRNLYKNSHLKETPLERGYVYMTREGLRQEAGQEPVEFASPAITKDSIFVGSETRGIEAFDRFDFRRRWALPIENGVSSEIVYDNNVLYFGANDGSFYAVDADFGKVLWKYTVKAPVFSRPSIVGNKIYISTSDDVVYCLDASSGKWVWHYKRSGNYITTVHGNSSPAVDSGKVYVGFSDGHIVSLNAADGNLQWEQKIHKGTKFTDVDAMPLVDSEHIYIPSYDGELYALEKNKGRVIWHIDVGGSKKVLIDDKTLFIGSSTGFVAAIQKDTGRILWKFEIDEGTPTNMVQHENYLAFGSSRTYFYAIHKGDGTLAFRENVGHRSGFVSTPVQDEKELFVFSNFGNLYKYKWKKAQAK